MDQAQLCFGEVRHRRLRPVEHSFAYRIFFMRLPLRAMARQGFGSRWLSRNRFNLLSFHDCDHGDGSQAPADWADAMLRAEGVHDADGEIWLQTFPRVLGYVFNPVSFWFCHRRDGTLRAILCEVNNTFGEKHCYLLDTGGAMPYGIALTACKCFHVSPFFAVEGTYRFRFMRAKRGNMGANVARIEYADAAGDLLKTSISGRESPVNDATVLRAFFGHPLMTLGVVLRIHWQALRLWRKRIPFFHKPQPPLSGVSR
ncbi:MAG: DUF1365 domain-containing protein [Burkholderiaceae bacterium]|nr:DUF1365 domain-containing protein [Burkholderiaceae bacterium]